MVGTRRFRSMFLGFGVWSFGTGGMHILVRVSYSALFFIAPSLAHLSNNNANIYLTMSS